MTFDKQVDIALSHILKLIHNEKNFMLQPPQPTQNIDFTLGQIDYNLSKRTFTIGYASFEKFSNQAVEKRMLSKIVFWQNANNPNESNLQTLIFHTMSHTLLISRKTTKQEIELCTNNF